MHLIHLTPGTGNFHCGSCHRDQHLARALRRRGHEVTMIPLYLPLVTDGPAESGSAPVFAGGINLFLQQKFRLFRHTPRWLDKMLDHPWLLRLAGRGASMTSPRQLGEMTLETLLGTDGRQAKEWDRLINWIQAELKPDAVSLSNGLLLGLAPRIKQDLGVPIYASLQGEDSFLDTLPEPYSGKCWEKMRELSRLATRCIATSHWYAENMSRRLGLSPEAIASVPNGMDYQGYGLAENAPEYPTIGFLARMIPGKGLDQLVEAFLMLCQENKLPSVRLAIGGTKIAADEPFIRQQQEKIARAGLTDRVTWRPNLSFEEKVAFYQSLSVLSVPASYGEAFGLYVLEALACGVPVVEPDHAGLGELVRATGGGLLTEPNSVPDLAAKLTQILTDSALRQKLAHQGRQVALEQYSADAMAARFFGAIDSTLCR